MLISKLDYIEHGNIIGVWETIAGLQMARDESDIQWKVLITRGFFNPFPSEQVLDIEYGYLRIGTCEAVNQ